MGNTVVVRLTPEEGKAAEEMAGAMGVRREFVLGNMGRLKLGMQPRLPQQEDSTDYEPKTFSTK